MHIAPELMFDSLYFALKYVLKLGQSFDHTIFFKFHSFINIMPNLLSMYPSMERNLSQLTCYLSPGCSAVLGEDIASCHDLTRGAAHSGHFSNRLTTWLRIHSATLTTEAGTACSVRVHTWRSVSQGGCS